MASPMQTANISRSGILVAWRAGESAAPMPAIGRIITVEIELPANHGFGQKCMHCQGTVTRITQGSDCPTLALRVNYMDFRSFHDRIRALEAMQPAASSWIA